MSWIAFATQLGLALLFGSMIGAELLLQVTTARGATRGRR
jgi:hypothetical protein